MTPYKIDNPINPTNQTNPIRKILQAMDAVINTRINLVLSLIDDHDMYAAFGIDAFACIFDIAQQISNDVNAFRKSSWAPVAAKYWDLVVLSSLMKRRAQIHDVIGLKWCLNEVASIQSKANVCVAW